ncbi:MAG: NADPH-dependent F420 reductase [Acidimicrobiia bacterium]|nr:NADPH-dependent F420 reductase [Acidimicrobiia bacterium]
MHVGILGGTGPAGKALAARLASAGIDVVIGSRSRQRGDEMCDELRQRWPDRDLPLTGAENVDAATADVVVVATPWDAAAATAASVADRLTDKVVISMANALTRLGKEFVPLVPGRGSIAAGVQAAVPGARVAAAFHHLPAHSLGDLSHTLESDVLICADHPDAASATAELVAKVPGLRPVHAGSLAAALPIEAFTAVLLQVNVRYKTRAAIRITGLDV